MQAELESISPVKKKLSVKVPEADVIAEFDGVYNNLGKKAQIPGFRKGKVPREILEKRFATDVEAEVIENLIRKTMFDAIKKHGLDIVTNPEISEPKRETGSGFSYIASVEVKPIFEVKNYTGLKLKKPSAEPKDAQIEEVIKKLQDGQAVLKPREGATTPLKGDYVSLAIQGIDAEGNLTAPKEEPKEQVYEIGGGILHEAVEKAAIKLKIDEAAPVTISPKDKKEFHIRVTLKAIKEKILPSLNDEFAKSLGAFENMKILRDRVREDLVKEMEENARGELAKQALDQLVKNHKIDLPPSLVDQELHNLIHNVWSQLERAGIKEIPEEYSEKKLHDKLEPDAKRRVHEQLIIEAVAKKETIDISDEEVAKVIAEHAKASRIPVAELRAYYEKSNRIESVRFSLLAKKTVDFLLSKAAV